MCDQTNIQKCLKENNLNYEILRVVDDNAQALIQDYKERTTIYEIIDERKGLYYMNTIHVNASTEEILNELVTFSQSLQLELKHPGLLQIKRAQYLEENDIKQYFIIITPRYYYDLSYVLHCKIERDLSMKVIKGGQFVAKSFIFHNNAPLTIKQNYYLLHSSNTYDMYCPVLNLFTNDWLQIKSEDSFLFTEKQCEEQDKLRQFASNTLYMELLLDFKIFLVYIEKYYQNIYQKHKNILQYLSEKSNIQKFDVYEMSNDYFILTVKEEDNDTVMYYKYEKINEQNKEIVEKYSEFVQKNIMLNTTIRRMYINQDYLVFEEKLVNDINKNNAKWLLGSMEKIYEQFQLLTSILELMINLKSNLFDRYIDISAACLMNFNPDKENQIYIPNPLFRMENRDEKNRDFLVKSLLKMITSTPFIQEKSYIKNTLLEELDKIKNTDLNRPTDVFKGDKRYYEDLLNYIRKLRSVHYNFQTLNKLKIDSEWNLCLNYKVIPNYDCSIQFASHLKFNLKSIYLSYLKEIANQIRANKNVISLSLINISDDQPPLLSFVSNMINLRHLKLNYLCQPHSNQLLLKNLCSLKNLQSLRIQAKLKAANFSRYIRNIANLVNIYLDQKLSITKIGHLTKQKIIATPIFMNKQELNREFYFNFSVFNNFKPYKQNQNDLQKSQQPLLKQQNNESTNTIFNKPQQSTYGLFSSHQNNPFNSISSVQQQSNNHTHFEQSQQEQHSNNNNLSPFFLSSITSTFENKTNLQHNSISSTETDNNHFSLSQNNPFNQTSNPFKSTNNPFSQISQGIDASQNNNKTNQSPFSSSNNMFTSSPNNPFQQNNFFNNNKNRNNTSTSTSSDLNNNNNNSSLFKVEKVDNLFGQPSNKTLFTLLSDQNQKDQSFDKPFFPQAMSEQLQQAADFLDWNQPQYEDETDDNKELKLEIKFEKFFEFFEIQRNQYSEDNEMIEIIQEIQNDLKQECEDIWATLQNIQITFNFTRDNQTPILIIDFIDNKKKHFGNLQVTMEMNQQKLIIKKLICRSQEKLGCHLLSLKGQMTLDSELIEEWYTSEQLTDLNFYMIGSDYVELCKEGDYNQLQQQFYIHQNNLTTLGIGVMVCQHILEKNIPLFKFNPNQIRNLYDLTLHIKNKNKDQLFEKQMIQKLKRDLLVLKRLVILKIVMKKQNNKYFILKKLPRLVKLSQKESY